MPFDHWRSFTSTVPISVYEQLTTAQPQQYSYHAQSTAWASTSYHQLTTETGDGNMPRTRKMTKARFTEKMFSQMHFNQRSWRFERYGAKFWEAKTRCKYAGKFIPRIMRAKTMAQIWRVVEEMSLMRQPPRDRHFYLMKLRQIYGRMSVTQAVKLEPAGFFLRTLDRHTESMAGLHLPWKSEIWWYESPYALLHCVQPGAEHPEQISYFPTPDKMGRGQRVATKPGRYLAKYFPDYLTNDTVKRWAVVWENTMRPVNVKWAREEKDLIRVIAKGPSESCMADSAMGGIDWYAGHVHPAVIYDTPDIEIAYLEDAAGRITARCVCNAKTKKAARCYGDHARLVPALEKLGYQQATHALVGARIRRIPNERGDGFIMAYVDAGIASGGGSLYFEFIANDKFFKLTDEEIDGQDTYAGYDRQGVTRSIDDCSDDNYDGNCASCGCGVYEGDVWTAYDDDYCGDCYAARFREAIINATGETDSVRKEETVKCSSNDQWYHRDIVEACHIHFCDTTSKYWTLPDLLLTPNGWVKSTLAVKLDVAAEGIYHVAKPRETSVTFDGRTIWSPEMRVIAWYDGTDYLVHKDDRPEDLLPDVRRATTDDGTSPIRTGSNYERVKI